MENSCHASQNVERFKVTIEGFVLVQVTFTIHGVLWTDGIPLQITTNVAKGNPPRLMLLSTYLRFECCNARYSKFTPNKKNFLYITMWEFYYHHQSHSYDLLKVTEKKMSQIFVEFSFSSEWRVHVEIFMKKCQFTTKEKNGKKKRWIFHPVRNPN